MLHCCNRHRTNRSLWKARPCSGEACWVLELEDNVTVLDVVTVEVDES